MMFARLLGKTAVVPSEKIRILFLIRSLVTGGAQRQLALLAQGLDKQRFEVMIVTFYDGGELWAEVEALENVQVISLGKNGRWDFAAFLARYLQLLYRFRPHIVHGYLNVANELALIGRLVGAKVFWGIRASNMALEEYNWAIGWTFRLGAWLSRFADCIIVNSQAGRTFHVQAGYDQKAQFIPNGIDVSRFKPDREAGQKVRQGWNVGSDDFLIGLVGRLDPMKGHETFLQAAGVLAKHNLPHVKFVCVGSGDRTALQEIAKAHQIEDRLIWANFTNDITAVYNALDLVSLASAFGEGFPNVVGEAMACGRPCVVTNVGDAAYVLGNPTYVVPIQSPIELATAWQKIMMLSDAQREQLSAELCKRIRQEFSVQRLVGDTEKLFFQLVQMPSTAL